MDAEAQAAVAAASILMPLLQYWHNCVNIGAWRGLESWWHGNQWHHRIRHALILQHKR